MDFDTYKTTLLSNGKNLSQVRRKQSDTIINITFTGDPSYKRCRILTDDGWSWVDVKYQKHTTPSILKDEVDYYLQFRPGVHYKLGTYVIVPDDTSPEVNTPENPFDQPISERTQWWLIVGRTDANAYVRYSILKCNWNFQWVYDGEIHSVFGCVRNANSYTSGVYTDLYTTSLDNITSAWLPDTFYTYKNRTDLGLDDIRSIDLKMRFMISDNSIHPKTYEVSKVTELVPAGVVKLTLKQHAYDEKRDNVSLRICDYYDASGNPLVNPPTPVIPDPTDTDTPTSKIHWCYLNDEGELAYAEDSPEPIDEILKLKTTSYFYAEFSDEYTGKYVWSLKVKDDYINDAGETIDKYTEEREEQLENYITMTDYQDGSLYLRPARVKDLIGIQFVLSVSDENGGHYSEIEMEVTA